MSRKPFAVYAITTHGVGIAGRLRESLPTADLYIAKKFLTQVSAGALELPLPMGPLLGNIFTAYDCHIFIISIGAVVRMIAPLLANKKVDPAVICVDDAARWSICVLSGHVGRGNLLADRVAGALGATPVVTTASDVRGTLTVDILGRDLGWTLDDPDRNVTSGCAAVVNAAPVVFVQETGEPDWWPQDRPLPPGVRYGTSLDEVHPGDAEILLIATDRDIARSHPQHFEKAVIYRPKSLGLGLGCDKGTSPELLERGVRKILRERGLSLASVKRVATIDVKREEPAIVALCAKFGWPMHTYPAAVLDAVPGIETPSEMVRKHVGTRAVAEPAALLAAGAEKLLVAKQSYTEEGVGRSMTLAVARIPFSKRKITGTPVLQEVLHG